ncbi:MAG: phospholipase effector Tle1 domain-containing protein [Pikeienuella sp.]
MTALIYCFDGTWNGRDDANPTNIQKLWRAMNRPGQMTAYFAGPGNEDENSWLMEKLGGAFGVGSWDIRDQAIDHLASVYQPDSRIAVLGFSRGAAIARMFCSQIAGHGIYGQYPDIEFLGCFDTVFARLPITGWQQRTLFSDLHVAANVQHAYHAVAVDEDRAAFTPNLMNQRDGITEVWFPGGHSDIGGGNPSTGLSDIALEWMVDCAADHGIACRLPVLAPDFMAPMTVSDQMLRHKPRRIGVKVRNRWADLPATLHESVYHKQTYDPIYREKWKHL